MMITMIIMIIMISRTIMVGKKRTVTMIIEIENEIVTILVMIVMIILQ